SCDQAVLVAGGWNPDAGLDGTEAAVARVHAKLRDVGFSAAAVQTFYADRRSRRLADTVAENLHAAGGMKVAFQQHLQRLCRTDYCVNNLVIYLRSPALLDGSLLLWDFNNDYDVSRDEEYSPEELLADLSQCKARRVVVFLDSNFAERLAEQLRDLPNVAVLAASSKNNYAPDSLMSEVFFSNSSHLASPGDSRA
uniref:NYN domain-containing protein n=1 Tax=Macrostomum lignano TaxID=282301 RepID=A0A1I8FSY1_9PLAT